MLDKAELEARMRQLLALDINALDIYGDLAQNHPDEDARLKLQKLVADEQRHVALSMELLSLLKQSETTLSNMD